MAEEFNIIIEHLKALRAHDASSDERLSRIERRLGTIEEHVGSLVRESLLHGRDFDMLRERVERIERRLELGDPQH